MADGFLVFTTGFQVVQDPLVVAVFFLDVFHQRLAHKLQPLREPPAASHHQRYRVFHVVVGLGQKPGVAFKVKATLLDGLNHRGSGDMGPGLFGFGLQSVKKCHVGDSWRCLLGRSARRHRKIHKKGKGFGHEHGQVSLNLMPHRAAVGGDMALGLGQRLPAYVHGLQTGVVGQTGIECRQGGPQRVRATTIPNHQQGAGLWFAITKHHGLGGAHGLYQLALQPFRADVAAKTGNDQVLGAAVNSQEALRADRPKVSGVQPAIIFGLVAQITQMGVAPHQNPPIVVHLNLYMRKRPAHSALPFSARYVQGHHRAALGQAVTFVQRQIHRPATGQQIW